MGDVTIVVAADERDLRDHRAPSNISLSSRRKLRRRR